MHLISITPIHPPLSVFQFSLKKAIQLFTSVRNWMIPDYDTPPMTRSFMRRFKYFTICDIIYCRKSSSSTLTMRPWSTSTPKRNWTHDMSDGLNSLRLHIHPASQSRSKKQSRWCPQPSYVYSDLNVSSGKWLWEIKDGVWVVSWFLRHMHDTEGWVDSRIGWIYLTRSVFISRQSSKTRRSRIRLGGCQYDSESRFDVSFSKLTDSALTQS